MIRGVVFDLDGTLIHNHTDFMKMRKCVVAELIQQGIPSKILDENDIIITNMARAEEYAAQHGINVPNLYKITSDIMSRIEMETVDLTEPIPGALEALIELGNESYKTGILTRGSRNYAETALYTAGLDIGYDAFICRDDYPEEESKPSPLAMIRAAEEMRIDVSECLYLGDHITDMNCAASAGAQFIGVLTGAYDAERWQKVGASYINSVASLPDILPLDL